MNLTRECLDYGKGAKIVGGVTPGRLGRDVHGVPVFDTVAKAVAHHGAPIEGSVVTVPPAFTKDAVFEAIENGVKLIVIVTERIPRRDVAEMVELAGYHGARIIGPNCLGIIVPDVIKMGGIGGPARWIAAKYGCRVTGVDLTAEFCEAARELNSLTGLTDRVQILHGSALSLPLSDNSFDRAYSQAALMNISYKFPR